MKDFGANARRVYHVDAEASHEGCMKAFADTGIYVLVDIDTFDTYITPVRRPGAFLSHINLHFIVESVLEYKTA